MKKDVYFCVFNISDSFLFLRLYPLFNFIIVALALAMRGIRKFIGRTYRSVFHSIYYLPASRLSLNWGSLRYIFSEEGS